jgi:DNA-binding response OmpR family regulator
VPETTLLIVEDEPAIAEVVELYLRRAGYRTLLAADGQAALDILGQTQPDLVVLDLMLPHVDGYAVTRWIRDRGDTPIIIVSSRREESDRIAGLELGADDYLVKPFSPQELVSRVRAVLRRVRKGEAEAAAAVTHGDLTLDPATMLVTLQGRELSLTAKEFELLYHLARHPRHVFSRDQLLQAVWGTSDYIDPSTVTVHIRRLREKIETDPSRPERLVTVWGIGYRFEPLR